MKDYDIFTEEMVRYFLDHKEYYEDLLWLRKHRWKYIRFVRNLFRLWKSDPNSIDYHVAYLIAHTGRYV